jgi:maltose alpha-D-glucosyltransferase / alpha-amylase
VRTPMQWSAERGAGFSRAPRLVHPIIDEGFYSYTHVNVENQRRDSNSLLNWMTALIRLRKECPEIGLGTWEIMDVGAPSVLVMCYSWKKASLVIFHNFGEKPLEVVISRKRVGEERLVDLMKNIESIADEKGRHTIILDGYGYRWFRAGEKDRPYKE